MEGYFRVESTHPQLILKLLQQEEVEKREIASWLKRFFSLDFPVEDLAEKGGILGKVEAEGLPQPIQQTLQQWLLFLKGLSLNPPSPLDADQIRKIIAGSGLFLENKLKSLIDHPSKDTCDRMIAEDMRALLLKLKSQMTSLPARERPLEGDRPEWEEMLLGLDKILRKIEAYQILNLIPSTPRENIFLLLPFWFQGHLQFVEMNLSFPRPESKPCEGEEISILFLLQLPRWGRMNIEVKMKGKTLSSRFRVCSPEVSAFLSNGLLGLERSLNRIGFQPQLSISLEAPQRITETFLAELEREAESFLNIVI
jgi:hypothetical protein